MPLSPTTRGSIAHLLIVNEGYAERRYYDTGGHPTIGVGFNLDRQDAPDKLDLIGADYHRVRAGQDCLRPPQIDVLLEVTIAEAIGLCVSTFPNFMSINAAQQVALVDMAFTLGSGGLTTFTRFGQYVLAGNWSAAADEVTNSQWYAASHVRAGRDADALRGRTMPPGVTGPLAASIIACGNP